MADQITPAGLIAVDQIQPVSTGYMNTVMPADSAAAATRVAEYEAVESAEKGAENFQLLQQLFQRSARQRWEDAQFELQLQSQYVQAQQEIAQLRPNFNDAEELTALVRRLALSL